MRQQATKASREHVELHIERQRVLGERMIGDHDKPRKYDLIVTLMAIVIIVMMGV